MWELNEIEKKMTCKINALPKSVLLNNTIRESRAIKHPLMNYDTAQVCHGTVDKMAGIFTKGMVATLWWHVGKFALKNLSIASGVKRNFWSLRNF